MNICKRMAGPARRALWLGPILLAPWLGLHAWLNVPVLKETVLSAVSGRVGMPIRTGVIVWIPGRGMAIHDPVVSGNSEAGFSAELCRIRIRWMPLLKRRIDIAHIEWVRPSAVTLASHSGTVTFAGDRTIDLLGSANALPPPAAAAPPLAPPETGSGPPGAAPAEPSASRPDAAAPLPGEKPTPGPTAASQTETPESAPRSSPRRPPSPRLRIRHLSVRDGEFVVRHPESGRDLIRLQGVDLDFEEANDRPPNDGTGSHAGRLAIRQVVLFDGQFRVDRVHSRVAVEGPVVLAPELRGRSGNSLVLGSVAFAPNQSGFPFQVEIKASDVPLTLRAPGSDAIECEFAGASWELGVGGLALHPISWGGIAAVRLDEGRVTGSPDLVSVVPSIDQASAAAMLSQGNVIVQEALMESPLVTVRCRGYAQLSGVCNLICRLYLHPTARAALDRRFVELGAPEPGDYETLFGREGVYRDISVRGRLPDAETDLLGEFEPLARIVARWTKALDKPPNPSQ